MADLNTLMGTGGPTPEMFAKPVAEPEVEFLAEPMPYDDDELLALWKEIKEECLGDRWVWERQWYRNIMYVLGRQWIEYIQAKGGWRDKRMAQWIPRPVTNKCKTGVQTLRAMFTSIKLGVNVRPNGAAPENVSAAAVADELAPVIHDDHSMDQIISEFDFWLIVTGNAFLHTFVDYDLKYGVSIINHEECVACGKVVPQNELAGTQAACPDCGGTEFKTAVLPDGTPVQTRSPKGRPITIPLSPLELAFPNSYARFSDLPYVVRLRWKTKRYFENHPILKEMVNDIVWQKSPADQSLQLFKSLASHNDLGVSSFYATGIGGNNEQQDGIPEYEVWYKPCDKYPEGLVFRILGDGAGKVVHLEEQEGLPGPLPYTDAEGNRLFTFTHAAYEHVGGRILASGALDPMIGKQDQLNQLDSNVLLAYFRMANPILLVPKGMGITKMTGMPGLTCEYDNRSNPGAKPERLAGVDVPASAFKLREQYLADIEELMGTFDIIKGQKPTGVEAFSALQLLVERSQSRFSGVFQSRGNAYKDWFKFALELEREFGEEEKTKATFTPARKWSFQTFQRSQLQGSVSIIVEDGSNVPKTALGMRAAVEHANTLGMLNMQDPDQQYEGLKLFGLTKMIPTLDIHIQAALSKQQAFEEWIGDPMAQQQSAMQAEQEAMAYQQQAAQAPIDPMSGQPMAGPAPSPLNSTPLKWLPWYNPIIHRQEFMKWANSDRMRELMKQMPQAEGLLTAHLSEIDMANQQTMLASMPPPEAGPSGGAMSNSNANSAPAGNQPQPAQGV
jgi:hypothetical protein